MQVVNLTRKFKYNSMSLNDPNGGLSPDAVREFYSAHYPELINATVEGPVTAAGVATYTFVRSAGSKGRKAVDVPPLRTKLLDIIAGGQVFEHEKPLSKKEQSFVDALKSVFNKHDRDSKPMPIPHQAVGIWG